MQRRSFQVPALAHCTNFQHRISHRSLSCECPQSSIWEWMIASENNTMLLFIFNSWASINYCSRSSRIYICTSLITTSSQLHEHTKNNDWRGFQLSTICSILACYSTCGVSPSQYLSPVREQHLRIHSHSCLTWRKGLIARELGKTALGLHISIILIPSF